MTNTPDRETGDASTIPIDTGQPPGTPRWVKVFGLVAAVVILLFVVSLLFGVKHGPGRHGLTGEIPHGGVAAPPLSLRAGSHG